MHYDFLAHHIRCLAAQDIHAQLTIGSYVLGSTQRLMMRASVWRTLPQPPEAFEQPLGSLRRRLGSVKKGQKSILIAENPISAHSIRR
jgi:hypothetical protein